MAVFAFASKIADVYNEKELRTVKQIGFEHIVGG